MRVAIQSRVRKLPAATLEMLCLAAVMGREFDFDALAEASQLDEEALIAILTQPKNALVKQYEKLFEFENVALSFTEGALAAVARKALKQKSGARGLRAILERAMLSLMYELPSREDVEECVVGEEVIEQGAEPVLGLKREAESA